MRGDPRLASKSNSYWKRLSKHVKRSKMENNQALVYFHYTEAGQLFYVGISSNKDLGRAETKWNRSKFWQNKVSKHGLNVEIVHDGISWEEALKWEVHYIALYGRRNNNTGVLVNLTDGGDGVLGMVWSDEQKKAMSERAKKRLDSPEARKTMSEQAKKFFENPEARMAQSKRMKERFETAESRKTHTEKIKEYFKNPEAQRSHSEIMKKLFRTPEARRVMSERMKNYFKDPEARRANSDRLKDRNRTPEARKAMSERMKKHFASPEARRVVIESKKESNGFYLLNQETGIFYLGFIEAGNSIGLTGRQFQNLFKTLSNPIHKTFLRIDTDETRFYKKPEVKKSSSEAKKEAKGVYVLNLQTGIYYLGFVEAAESVGLTGVQFHSLFRSPSNPIRKTFLRIDTNNKQAA